MPFGLSNWMPISEEDQEQEAQDRTQCEESTPPRRVLEAAWPVRDSGAMQIGHWKQDLVHL